MLEFIYLDYITVFKNIIIFLAFANFSRLNVSLVPKLSEYLSNIPQIDARDTPIMLE